METDWEFLSPVWAETVHKFIFPVSLCAPLSFNAGKSLELEPDHTVKALVVRHNVFDMSDALLVLLKLTQNSGADGTYYFHQKASWFEIHVLSINYVQANK